MGTQTITTFLDEIFNEIKRIGIDVSDLKLDHCAYQTSSTKDYIEMKQEVSKLGKLHSEKEVGDRRIAVYTLTQPIMYKDSAINLLEIVEPKPDQKVASGWEHIELVVPKSLESFMKQYDDIDWDTSVIDREIFPMLILSLSNNRRVKFPRKGLLDELRRQEEER